MKRIFVIISLLLIVSIGFSQINWPFGAVDNQTGTSGVTSSLTIYNNCTYVTYASVDTNMTISLDINSQTKRGAKLVLETTCDATQRTITLSTGFSGSNFTLEASGTLVTEYIYDGTYFNQTSARIITTDNPLYYNSYPFGAIDYITSTTDSLTLAVTLDEQVTYLDISSGTLDTNLTINATVDSKVKKGAIVYIETTADGTNRTVTFGTKLTMTALTNTASKTFITTFMYDGTNYKAIAQRQID
jgi:hypothetical protein